MKVENFCTACNKKIDSNNNLKDRTVCQNCYNKNRRKYNNTLIHIEIITSNQKPKIENVNKNNNVNNASLSKYENHVYVVIGPETLLKLITCSQCSKNGKPKTDSNNNLITQSISKL